MGKKNDRKEKDKTTAAADSYKLKNETVGWVTATCLFAISVFFILASLDKAGPVGIQTFYVFGRLFGVGYFLLPTISLTMAIAFARSKVRPVSKIQYIGAGVLFISALSLIHLAALKGGVVGSLISTPLVKLFDTYVSAIVLVCLLIASVLVIFDAPINLGYLFSLFRKKENEEDLKERDVQDMVIKAPILTEEKPLERPVQINTEKPKPLGENKNGDFHIVQKSYSNKTFVPPPLSLLERDSGKPGIGDVKGNANIIKRTLQNFGIVVEMDEVSIGPSVTRYALKPAEGVKLSKILGLQNNLELALAAHPVRIEAPIPGKSLVGIEIPNTVKTTVGLATLLSDSEYQSSEKSLVMALGKGISGTASFANLAKMPHLLIAGATGSGKSVTIHALINSMLFRNPPENLKFIMIDPKRVELTLYNKIPHLLTPVITDAKKTIAALKWAAKEMDRRYNTLEKHKVRDIESYHKNVLAPAISKVKNNPPDDGEELPETMPYIVIVIDELADIMQAYPRELEASIVRLAQMSRAVGIHLILSTQRPSVNVITGLIKANVPSRIALQVASQIDSRTILDMAGAEKLLGAGDMLFMSGDMSKPVRLQSAYISEIEVKKVTEYLAKSYEDEIPQGIDFDTAHKNDNAIFSSSIGDEDGEDEDDLYAEAKDTVIRSGKASTSFLQRKLRIGYARAARLVDILEEKGIVGPGDGAKQREVLVKPEGGIEPMDNNIDNGDNEEI